MENAILKNAQRELLKHEMNYFSEVVHEDRKITVPDALVARSASTQAAIS